jgi:hypothetical protein
MPLIHGWLAEWGSEGLVCESERGQQWWAYFCGEKWVGGWMGGQVDGWGLREGGY